MGNRLTNRWGGDGAGEEATYTNAYGINGLNQIKTATHPSGFQIIGSADTGTTVTIESDSVQVQTNVVATRVGSYFRADLDYMGRTTGEVYASISVKVAEGMNTTVFDEGSLFFPTNAEAMSYDLDGNLLKDGRWSYSWDSENRLARMQTRWMPNASGSMPNSKIDCVYDHQGRRVGKTVYDLDPVSSNFVERYTTTYLYDGWNLIEEVVTQTGASLTNHYTWGTDLSGSRQGAGGVGGLLVST
ncbi:MAG: hypothetical protein AAF492_14425, partial [Verrucomicrobiota bacterium]